ncbi:MAG: hypothetical protein A2138_05475 [Deltaproteobacteria bacterium RBG_16_71_12]|nr:MAG: hypothetical protein A2138_05475 [Deltaproteobacteria bacterium RBG_16_71_12]
MLAVACAAAFACKEAPPPPPPPPPPVPTAAEVDVTATDDERRCAADADCALATVDCCGCNALGKQTGVRKDKLVALTDRRRPICGTIACAQGMSDDPSCVATRAVCRDGSCVAETAGARPQGVGVGKITD